MFASAIERESNDLRTQLARIRATVAPPLEAYGGDAASSLASAMAGGQESQRLSLHYRGWVYASQRPLAERLSTQPVRVARLLKQPQSRGLKADQCPAWLKSHVDPARLDVIEDHEILRAIDYVNPFMVRQSLFFTTVSNLVVAGRAFWMTLREKGVFTIYPLPSAWVQPRLSRERLIEGWMISRGGRSPVPVPLEDILFFNEPDPFDPVLGSFSRVEAMQKTLRADEAIEAAQEAGFHNGIYPGLAILMGAGTDATGKPRTGKTSGAQRRTVLQWFKEHYQGAYRFGEPLILDERVRDVKAITQTPQEMAFTESAKLTKAKITQVMGVNPILMGEIEGANRASSYEAENHGAKAVNALGTLMSQCMTKWLAPKFAKSGETLIVWIEEYKPDDADFRLRAYDIGVSRGLVTKNEYRQGVLGLPPDPAGDVYMVPFTSVAVPAGEEAPEVVPQSEPEERQFLLPMQKRLSRNAGLKAAWISGHRARERELAPKIAKWVRAEVVQIAKRIEAGETDVAKLMSVRKMHSRLMQTVKPIFERSFVTGVALVYSSLGLAPKPATPVEAPPALRNGHLYAKQTVDLLPEFGLELPEEFVARIDDAITAALDMPYWRKIPETMRDDVFRHLSAGIDAGESARDIAERVREAMGGEASRSRAMLVARTETTNSMNAGQRLGAEELLDQGIVLRKRWLSVQDDRTRDDHAEMDGVEVEMAEPFVVGGEEADHPGDPNLSAGQRANCRCAIQFVPVT